MTIDNKTMLNRVVTEVFDQKFAAEDATSNGHPSRLAVRVMSRRGPEHTVIIRASSVWLDAFIPELNVQSSVLDDSEVEVEKEDELRRLCRVMHAYFRVEGSIAQRWRLLGIGTAPVLKVEVDGHKWSFGRNYCSVR